MSYVHFLTPDESLDNLLGALKERVQRPVYAASTLNHRGSVTSTLYREPGRKSYRTAGVLELYLSRWDDHGRCVERTKNDIFKFDLFPATHLHLLYPLLPGERNTKETIYFDEHFKALGLSCALNNDRYGVYPNEADEIPRELQPYYQEYKRRGRDKFYMCRGIRFAVSQLIEAPTERRRGWHVGIPFKSEGKAASSVQAPGWYSGRDIDTLESINRICFCDSDLGRCIVCHGKSGERRHIAFMQSSGQGAYPSGHICRVCFPSVAKAWQGLLDEWTPPELPAEPAKQ